MDKELLYRKLNDILDCLENGQFSGGKSQLENLINEIKMGVYDE
jgi:hypothetical protein|tara:strand:- start:567 stop:698 length:132 start_codon:yes stop_codon:yes gene_type:complete